MEEDEEGDDRIPPAGSSAGVSSSLHSAMLVWCPSFTDLGGHSVAARADAPGCYARWVDDPTTGTRQLVRPVSAWDRFYEPGGGGNSSSSSSSSNAQASPSASEASGTASGSGTDAAGDAMAVDDGQPAAADSATSLATATVQSSVAVLLPTSTTSSQPAGQQQQQQQLDGNSNSVAEGSGAAASGGDSSSSSSSSSDASVGSAGATSSSGVRDGGSNENGGGEEEEEELSEEQYASLHAGMDALMRRRMNEAHKRGTEELTAQRRAAALARAAAQSVSRAPPKQRAQLPKHLLPKRQQLQATSVMTPAASAIAQPQQEQQPQQASDGPADFVMTEAAEAQPQPQATG